MHILCACTDQKLAQQGQKNSKSVLSALPTFRISGQQVHETVFHVLLQALGPREMQACLQKHCKTFSMSQCEMLIWGLVSLSLFHEDSKLKPKMVCWEMAQRSNKELEPSC